MCGLKKLASEVFPESWNIDRKAATEMDTGAAMVTAAEMDQKQ